MSDISMMKTSLIEIRAEMAVLKATHFMKKKLEVKEEKCYSD
jgi:hypothetical protein